jgi:hypothetical protein
VYAALKRVPRAASASRLGVANEAMAGGSEKFRIVLVGHQHEEIGGRHGRGARSV